jgi:hypothetical protein
MQALIPDSFISAHPLIINIGCSITASLTFLFIVLALFKPRIKISPFVCKNSVLFDQGKTKYMIKVVNHSLFPAYDVKVELHLLQRYAAGKGKMNSRNTPLVLVADNITDIECYRPEWMREANHCIRFRTPENLDAILADDFKSVAVKVTLRHGLTGLVKVFTEEYAVLGDIKYGTFKYGTAIVHEPI